MPFCARLATVFELKAAPERKLGCGVAEARLVHCVGEAASRRHVMRPAGISSRNRDAGLYDGAPQADRVVARLT